MAVYGTLPHRVPPSLARKQRPSGLHRLSNCSVVRSSTHKSSFYKRTGFKRPSGRYDPASRPSRSKAAIAERERERSRTISAQAIANAPDASDTIPIPIADAPISDSDEVFFDELPECDGDGDIFDEVFFDELDRESPAESFHDSPTDDDIWAGFAEVLDQELLPAGDRALLEHDNAYEAPAPLQDSHVDADNPVFDPTDFARTVGVLGTTVATLARQAAALSSHFQAEAAASGVEAASDADASNTDELCKPAAIQHAQATGTASASNRDAPRPSKPECKEQEVQATAERMQSFANAVSSGSGDVHALCTLCESTVTRARAARFSKLWSMPGGSVSKNNVSK